MTKEELVDPHKKILNTDAGLDFPPDLKPRELETLQEALSSSEGVTQKSGLSRFQNVMDERKISG